MRKTVVITLLMICFNVQAWAQIEWFGPMKTLDKAKYMVTYRLTYHEDTTNLENHGSEKMVLIIGNDISNFQSYRKYECDRVGRQKQKEGVLLDWIQSGAVRDYTYRYHFSIYKNYPKGKMTTIDKILFGDYYEYDEINNPFEWNILCDTAIVAGYYCQRATCDFAGRTWEAWFSEELPFNDGPYKFGGLPGLILNIFDTRGHYSFEFLSIEAMSKGETIGIEEKDYIKTTKQGFFDAVRIHSESLDYTDKVDDDVARRIYNTLQSRNNPIELERK